MRIGRQGYFAGALETLAIELCCIRDLLFNFPVLLSNSRPHLFLPRIMICTRIVTVRLVLGVAAVGVTLSERVETALHDGTPVDSRLCAVRLRGSCVENNRRSNKRNLFVVSEHLPTDCSSDALKDTISDAARPLTYSKAG